ncbi:MAG: DUF364 domain-containing protein [Eubacteriaceae bacterium]|nr:DUF364 domain-containing protein [Eubacteriaceae bacterium]
MWDIYDKLLAEIPKGPTVDCVHQGPTWTLVKAGDLTGIAVTINEAHLSIPTYDHLEGRSLKEVAALCKDWDFMTAGVGTAALNAWLSHSDFAADGIGDAVRTGNTFDDYAQFAKGKKVAVIGHFRMLERSLLDISQVSILERLPEPGDYPDSACEYILPEQDLVFITGSAFTNKTLPRLLELSKNARTVIVGPSTPLSDILFDYGVDELSGLVPGDIPATQFESIGCDEISLSKIGTRIRIKK